MYLPAGPSGHIISSNYDLCSIISFLGSSLNAVVVFNLEVTHATLSELKTTTAFNEEPKKENLAWKTERL